MDGYPQRIGFSRPSPRLPARPGPLAATLYDNDFGTGRDLGVTSRGRLWELPPGINSLSPDGRFLLTGQGGDSSQAVIQDLSTGRVRVLADVGASLDIDQRRRFRYLIEGQDPVRWSADASLLLASVGARPARHRQVPMVVDVRSGHVTAVGTGEPAGFRSLTEVVTVSKLGGKAAGGGIVATTTDLATGGSDDVALRLDSPWRADPDNALMAGVSPDGATLVLVEVAEGGFPQATLRLFSLADGSELPSRSIQHWDGCAPSAWLGEDPVMSTRAPDRGSRVVAAGGSRALVTVHHRLQSSCLQLTADALGAGVHRSLFGTWPYVWTWYWWELLIGSALGLLGVRLWLTDRSGKQLDQLHRSTAGAPGRAGVPTVERDELAR